ncbi:MAG: hypothetical protein IPM51_14625 [Sphingobacteriaceae bacterium]|nr:hypothetical protein [Sphingobacteriaceae bacterium]
MPLKEKSKILGLTYALFITVFSSCVNETVMTEAQKRENDSLRKVKQREYSDSMKRANPLLIMPPDSEYTGEYIDKYPTGIVKFKGMFRFGQRHGDWFSFYPNGMKWSELTFDNGLKQGKNVAYYQDGKIRYEGYYKNDIQDSVWIYYDSIGRVADSFTLNNGKVVPKN